MFYEIDMANANTSMDINVPGADPPILALENTNGATVGNIPNQANWAAMNRPETTWRRKGRLLRNPNGDWQKNLRDGRLFSV